MLLLLLMLFNSEFCVRWLSLSAFVEAQSNFKSHHSVSPILYTAIVFSLLRSSLTQNVHWYWPPSVSEYKGRLRRVEARRGVNLRITLLQPTFRWCKRHTGHVHTGRRRHSGENDTQTVRESQRPSTRRRNCWIAMSSYCALPQLQTQWGPWLVRIWSMW